eukprot:CAMPEP_0194490250 /NCGR_PEP_ID=MMETSP0253-20130528/9533_1 /TAXON_ID=2966 /ORGANISM="Noctiluca scintillans" /LENGTH=153 /DNA_ID=CAMNT_0039330859 /DNA_START=1 /DNA_END=459 /DNA_ORIENTATION=+
MTAKMVTTLALLTVFFFALHRVCLTGIASLDMPVPDARSGRKLLGMAAAAPPPDFSGDWLLVEVKGDPNKILQLSGISGWDRWLAKTVKYGAGKTWKHYEQDGDHVDITVHLPMGVHREEFTVGAGRETAMGMRKAVFERSVTWQGTTLHQEW